MPEKEFNEVFARRLRYYLDKYEMSQLELAQKLGVGTTSVSNWVNGIKSPRMDKVDAMCDLFGCRRSDLMEEAEDNNGYYLNHKTAQAAQEIFENRDLRVLFDAARNASPEDLKTATNVLKALMAKEKGYDGDDPA